ncbi:MAG: hypothetical protein LBE17_00560, partial [Treponema sp.]|jgi:DNA adenine methylase|nr:hypothetical protein [Treponema sp.]
LKLLESLQGKFLLSSYRNKSLADFTGGNGWHTIEFAMSSPMTHGHKTQGRKIEVLTGNYPIAEKPGAKRRRGKVSGEEE